jgi:hypothetical protein
VSYFSRLQKYLRPDGRVAIIDFDRRAWFEGLWSHHTPPERIKREMEQAGYVVQQEFDFLDRQSFMIFAKREPAERSRSGISPMTAMMKEPVLVLSTLTRDTHYFAAPPAPFSPMR